MKTAKKLINWSFLLFGVSLPPMLVYTSCNQYNPFPSMDPKIICPDIKRQKCEIRWDHTAHVVFSGFSYEGMEYHSLLSVNNSFHQGKSRFESTIVNWNPQEHTFGVQVDASYVSAEILQGSLTFTYDGLDVPCEQQDNFTIEITDTRSITAPDILFDEQVVDSHNCATFTLGSFSCTNLPDIENKLHVDSFFAQEGASFETSIEFLTNTTFNIKIVATNMALGTLSSKLQFTYDNEILKNNVPLNDFEIIADAFPVVYAPDASSQTIFCHDDHAQVKIGGFRAVGINDPENIKIASSFTSSTTYGTFSVSITDWNPTAKTFAALLDIQNPKIVDKIMGDFQCTYLNQIVLETTEKIYGVGMNIFIPVSYLSITRNEDGLYVLNGLQNEPIPQDFNSLEIPSWVSIIGDNAFKDKLTVNGPNQHINYIKFPETSLLTKIGDYAFQGDTSIFGSITLPHSLESIGNLAFNNAFHSEKKCELFFTTGTPKLVMGEHCLSGANIRNGLTIPSNTTILKKECFSLANISGPLVIPSSIATVESNAFYHCKEITTIDLTSYMSIPEWISTRPDHDNLFEVAPSTVITHPVLYLSSKLSKTAFDTFSYVLRNTCKLPDSWAIQQR